MNEGHVEGFGLVLEVLVAPRGDGEGFGHSSGARSAIIRPAQSGDVVPIAELFHRTVREVNAADYTPAQIQIWAGEAPEPEKWAARLSVKRTFVCEVDGCLRGFEEFEDTGHIDALYVHADFQNQGVATRLLKHIEAEADRLGLDRLFTEASITARPFFEARGFTVLEEQEVWYRGCPFTNYRMERCIAARNPEPRR